MNGVAQRLAALGLTSPTLTRDRGCDEAEFFAGAIARFQEKYMGKTSPSGELDADTLQALRDAVDPP